MKHTLSCIGIVAGLVAAGPASAHPSCHIPAGRTIAIDRTAKLIAVPGLSGTALYACIRRTGRKVVLDERYADARLAGRWVSWQRHTGGQWRIAVHDLRTGRERLVDGHVADGASFLTTTGTAVWAQSFPDGVYLWANDVRTGGHLLDHGAIEPSSLRLSGRRVSWMKDGELSSADVR